MANICSNHLEVTGDQEQLEALHKSLIDQDPALLKTVPNFTISNSCDYSINSGEYITFNDDVLCIDFGSKWNSPLDEIEELSNQYPDLVFEINFEECGNEVFGKAFIKNGSSDITEMEEIPYLEEFNSLYIMELEDLNNCTYEQFLEKYTHDNFFIEHPFGYIDRCVVARIEKKDLPKFINRQWFDEKAENEYKRRLTESSTVDPCNNTLNI